MSIGPIERNAMTAGGFQSSAATHPGTVRERNEDNYVNRPDLGLWAVADGAGGHQAGDVASTVVTDALRAVPAGLGTAELLAEVRLRVDASHERLRAEAARRGADAVLATTVVVLLARGNHYACLWAGDSRAYLLRAGILSQVSHDHSFVQELVDAGAITPAEAMGHPRANVITRAVGAGGNAVDLDKVTDRLRVGDRFLLCSDGISKTLAEDEITRILSSDGDSPATQLISAALEQQADDNVTAVMIEVGADPTESDTKITRPIVP